MINFAVAKREESAQIKKLRQRGIALTWIVLVVWLVGIGAVGGRLWYLNTKKEQISEELQQLTTELAQNSTKEIRYKQIMKRAEAINSFLSARRLTAGESKLLAEATPAATTWEIDTPAATNLIKVNAAQITQIEDYLVNMKNREQPVELDMLIWDKLVLWEGTLSYIPKTNER